MTPPALLIVTGHPATGKTTLARALATTFDLPVVSKDAFKEAIFATIGWRDRGWSRQVGVAALALLYHTAGQHLATGRSLIVESNFRPDLDTPRMRSLYERQPFRPIQLCCVAANQVMVARYNARIVAGERHPGHCERPDDDAAAALLALDHAEPLPLGGELLTIDTSDPAAINMAAILEWTRAALTPPASRSVPAERSMP